jgi:recombinational DNA repair protein (RecF pathway)
MPSSRDRAICLRTFAYSETSQILTLFCRRTGIIRAIAKGAHRRTKAGASSFDGGVDLLDVGDCVFIHHHGRELATLTEWKLVEGHLELRNQLRSLLIGQYLAETLTALIGEHDPHPVLFDRMRVTLPALSTARIEEEFLAMQLDVLQEAGYLPDFDDPADPAQARIDPRLIGIAKSILKLPRIKSIPQRLPRLSRAQTNPLTAYIAMHIQNTIQKPLQSARYVVR